MKSTLSAALWAVAAVLAVTALVWVLVTVTAATKPNPVRVLPVHVLPGWQVSTVQCTNTVPTRCLSTP